MRPDLVLVTMVLSFGVKGFALRGEGGSNGCGAMCLVTFIALDLELAGFGSGRGKEGLGMNGSLESRTSTLLRLMILPFSNLMSYVLSLRCSTMPLHQCFGLWSVMWTNTLDPSLISLR